MSSALDRVFAALTSANGVPPKKSGEGWKAKCPAHDDRTPSLSVGEGRVGNVLLHCHRGCSIGDVLAALGLKESDLFPPALSGKSKTRRSSKAPVAREIPYELRDVDGSVIAVHVRLEREDGSKDFVYRRDGKNGLRGLPKRDLPLYGVHELPELGSTVYVVEGEKARDALQDRGVPAVGTATGSSSVPSVDALRPLVGYSLVVWPDADDCGRSHMDKLLFGLGELGFKDDGVRVIEWPAAPATGDAHDYFEAGGTVEGLASLPAATPARVSPGGEKDEEPTKQVDRLLAIAENFELFHDPARQAYAVVSGATLPVTEGAFQDELAVRYFEKFARAASRRSLSDAIATIAMSARVRGEEHDVCLRTARVGEAIYVDTGRDDGLAIEVDAQGWRIVEDVPVRFLRTSDLPMPLPVEGGDPAEMFEFVSVSRGDRPLILGFLVAGLWPGREYPIFNGEGVSGCGKTRGCEVMARLIDPWRSQLLNEPKNLEDVVSSAQRRCVLGYDNLDHVPKWLSDVFCRLSTGAGVEKRRLYTDAETFSWHGSRPVIINGISQQAQAADLLTRAIVVEFQPLGQSRLTVDDFWTRFEEAWPRMLGSVLTLLSTALRNIGQVKIKNPPRMYQFAKVAVAAEPAMGCEPGAFLRAYHANRTSANENALGGSPVFEPLSVLLGESSGRWIGTASELLEALEGAAGERSTKSRKWPKSAATLSRHLTEIAPSLNLLGIEVERLRASGGQRTRSIEVRAPGDAIRDDSGSAAEGGIVPAESRPAGGQAAPWDDRDGIPALSLAQLTRRGLDEDLIDGEGRVRPPVNGEVPSALRGELEPRRDEVEHLIRNLADASAADLAVLGFSPNLRVDEGEDDDA